MVWKVARLLLHRVLNIPSGFDPHPCGAWPGLDSEGLGKDNEPPESRRFDQAEAG